ncbi:hypothetical protein Tsubulata_043426, partial [Turnera subulata]
FSNETVNRQLVGPTGGEAHDHLDPNGNITIKWDLISWTPDGYVAVVTISNFQKYRNIKKPGWTLGWTWARKEIIWAMMGAQTTEQGDCSKFKGNIPHSCKKNPTAVDLLPGTPYNQQIANCCKAGVLSSWGKDPSASVSAFQISVGIAGTTNRTVQLPKNFTFLGPGKGYKCGPAKIVRPTVFQSSDGRRKTQALKAYDYLDPNGNITIKWDVISWTPDGYVAMVTMNNFQMYRHIVSPGWTLGWTWAKKEIIWSMVGAQATEQGDCSKFKSNIPHCCKKNPTVVDLLPGVPYNQQIANCCKGGVLASWGQDPTASVSSFQILSVVGVNTPRKDNTPLLLCTEHMCPVRVHWHVKLNYKEYWRVKIAITNFNYRQNYSQWTLVVQHPNLNNVTQVFSFNYKPLVPYQSTNDSGMFYGVKFFNDVLMEAGPDGNLQTELLLTKDLDTFTFNQGWGFPRKIYFNGEECMMPSPEDYPYLPNSASKIMTALSTLMTAIFTMELTESTKYSYQRKQCSLFPEMKFMFLVALVFMMFSYAAAYDPLDPNGNVTIKWDIMSWTPDGYVATVTMNNFQMYRHIMSPGWTLSWTWAKKEVIWNMQGAQTTEQGDCSKFKGNIPHCCKKTPTVVDLLPGVPYNQQFSNCCKGGVLAAWGQDPVGSVSAFQVSVGQAGTSNKTVKLPKNFTLLGPGPGYTCGPAKVVPSTIFLTPDRRRKTQALMTWNVTCTYSQFLASKNPTCCGINTPKKDNTPLLQCTHHMCPIRVHWHVKVNYKDYWRAKIAVTNFNYRMNYTEWTLVVQHPNLNNVTQVFSFDYKPLVPYESINDTGMFYGMKFYNDLLMEAGPFGNVLLQKDKDTFTLKQGWAFPRKVYFNGEECMLPPPDTYPYLPNSARANPIAFLTMAASLLLMFLSIW